MSNKFDEKLTGTIKVYYPLKGYGFITREKGRDIFFHYTEITSKGGDGVLMEGDKVSFFLICDAGKTKAIKVNRIG